MMWMHLDNNQKGENVMSELRITGIKTYIVPMVPEEEGKFNKSKTFLFVKLETNKGIEGWGEAYVLASRERSTVMLINEMESHLIGYDPYNIKSFQYWAYNKFGEKRVGIDLFCAISGIEIAMWDIMGKHLNVPVYSLLGGPVRDKIRVYANISCGFKTIESEIEKACEMKELGYTAVKIYPFLYGHNEDGIVDHVARVREAIGYDMDLLLDVWRDEDAKLPLNVAKRIEKYRVCYFEEPIAPDNLAVAAELRRNTNLPIVAGECICGKRGFNDVIRAEAADIFNVDVSVAGGILEMKEIASMAEANYIKIAPHNCNSPTVATNATVHVVSTMPNFFILETFPSYREMGAKICKNMLSIVDGYIQVPHAPGLGIEMNEEFLASIPYKESPNMNRNTFNKI